MAIAKLSIIKPKWVMEMFRKSKAILRGRRPEELLIDHKKFEALRDPVQAVELLQQVTEQLANADRHTLEYFILSLRQFADDIQFKYYKARCVYTIIPPEDSLAFWVCYALGSLPESIRFSSFKGEVLELLKILSLADRENSKVGKGTGVSNSVPNKAMDLALSLLKEGYPVFYNYMTKDPLLVPILDFSLKSKQGCVITIPRLHSLGVLGPGMNEEGLLVPILHALAHILHHYLTEDTKVIPPGFVNMHNKVFDDCPKSLEEWEKIFAETFVASLLYGTEFMPFMAYMEFSQEDQGVIQNYFIWLEVIFASSLHDNMQKIIHQWDELRRA